MSRSAAARTPCDVVTTVTKYAEETRACIVVAATA